MENNVKIRKTRLSDLPKYVRHNIYKIAKQHYIRHNVEGNWMNMGMCYSIVRAIYKVCNSENNTFNISNKSKYILVNFIKHNNYTTTYKALLELPEFNSIMKGTHYNQYITKLPDTKTRIKLFNKMLKETR